MTNIIAELKSEAKGFKVWTIENAVDFPDKELLQGDVILNSDKGAVLTAGGILQLTGAGKIGKSMLLLNLCYGLALGRDTLGFGIGKARKVLYVNGENSALTMQSRLRYLSDYYCIDDEQADSIRGNLLFASTGLLLPKPEAMAEIRGNLAEVKPEVLILDPLKNFYSGEENSADNMREFMAAVRLLIQQFNITVIIVHHTGKKQNDNSFYSGRGSSLLADDAETTASFQKDTNNKGLFNLFVTGRNCDEFTLHLTKQPERWYLYNLTDKPEPLPDHTLIEILEQLPAQFRTGAFEDAAHVRGIKRTTCFEKLKTLENGGIIKRVARGLYEKVSPEVRNTKGTELNELPDQLAAVVQVVQNSSDCTTRTTGPTDEYRGLF